VTLNLSHDHRHNEPQRRVMDDHEQNSSYTLLRIKRKRTDEPLDALGVYTTKQTRQALSDQATSFRAARS
jgi:hypothetical protein